MPNLRIPKAPGSQLFKEGYKHLQGLEEAILRNIDAVNELASTVRTSLGPNGRNKLIVNHLERLFVTSDAATITREMEVVHPAANLVVMASQSQEKEAGDGTNLVIMIAGELLNRAEPLLKMGIHPSEIVAGYEIAHKEALKMLEAESLSAGVVNGYHESPELMNAMVTAVGSKQYGYGPLLAELILEAVRTVVRKDALQKDAFKTAPPFNVDSIRVVKILGGSIHDSRVVRGMVFPREPEGTVKSIASAKVAVFTCPLDVASTETKGTVLLHNAKEMMSFSKDEEKFIESVLEGLQDAGVNVVVTGSTVHDLVLHFLNRMGIMAVKVLSKFDLRRLCKVTGAVAMTRLGRPLPEEVGQCDFVEVVEIGSDRCTVFRQEAGKTQTSTIVIRGGTQNFCDDLERAVDDGVNTMKALSKDGRLVPGAGATEMAISTMLHKKAEQTPGLYQYSIKAYAEALEIVPRTLSENAGQSTIEVISNLGASYTSLAGLPTGKTRRLGINVDESSTIEALVDTAQAGIVDTLATKSWALKHAAETAFTILRVDEIIMAKRAGGPKPRGQNPNWDED